MILSIHKNIILKKQPPLRGLFNILILILTIPVIIITMISICIYFLFDWFKRLLKREKPALQVVENYHFELNLIQNEYVQIIMVEDELDKELTQLNEAWKEKVSHKETCLYRARTFPVIPELEGNICCFYCKEQDDGVLLQLLTGNKINNLKSLSSQLVFLDYQNFNITLIDETGPFFLYNDDQNAQVINGFNKKEMMSLELIKAGSS